MTVNIAEAIDSGDISKTSAKFTVLCWDVPDAQTAFLEVLNAAPPTFNNGIRTLYLISTGSVKWKGGYKYQVGPIEYGTEDAAAAAAAADPETATEVEFGYDFEIGGGTAHITQSLVTISTHSAPPPGGTGPVAPPPDFKGAINVTKDNVEGADIPARSMSFSLTRTYLTGQINRQFKRTVYDLCCCVNTQTFDDFDAGEVLFLGASGSDKGKGTCTVNFKFQAIPNGTFNVGDIVGISKKGHELLWIRYADQEDATAKCLVKRPFAAYVEKVLQDGDLNDLPIPFPAT